MGWGRKWMCELICILLQNDSNCVAAKGCDREAHQPGKSLAVFRLPWAPHGRPREPGPLF